MRRSISARLSFWIVLATALLFLGMILYLASVWRSGVRKEVDKDARQVLESAVFHLDDILDDAKRTADVAFLDSRTLIKRLDAAVASHVADAEPSDDLTMLCLQISR